MGLWEFIKKLFTKEKPDYKIEVSDGRAVCKICYKKLDGRIYTINGVRGCFCKKHAKKIANEKFAEQSDNEPYYETDMEPISEQKGEKKHYYGRCTYCGRKALGVDVYRCSYCHNHYCTNHRLPESHDCSGNPRKPRGGFREVHSASGEIRVYGK